MASGDTPPRPSFLRSIAESPSNSEGGGWASSPGSAGGLDGELSEAEIVEKGKRLLEDMVQFSVADARDRSANGGTSHPNEADTDPLRPATAPAGDGGARLKLAAKLDKGKKAGASKGLYPAAGGPAGASFPSSGWDYVVADLKKKGVGKKKPEDRGGVDRAAWAAYGGDALKAEKRRSAKEKAAGVDRWMAIREEKRRVEEMEEMMREEARREEEARRLAVAEADSRRREMLAVATAKKLAKEKKLRKKLKEKKKAGKMKRNESHEELDRLREDDTDVDEVPGDAPAPDRESTPERRRPEHPEGTRASPPRRAGVGPSSLDLIDTSPMRPGRARRALPRPPPHDEFDFLLERTSAAGQAEGEADPADGAEGAPHSPGALVQRAHSATGTFARPSSSEPPQAGEGGAEADPPAKRRPLSGVPTKATHKATGAEVVEDGELDLRSPEPRAPNRWVDDDSSPGGSISSTVRNSRAAEEIDEEGHLATLPVADSPMASPVQEHSRARAAPLAVEVAEDSQLVIPRVEESAGSRLRYEPEPSTKVLKSVSKGKKLMQVVKTGLALGREGKEGKKKVKKTKEEKEAKKRAEAERLLEESRVLAEEEEMRREEEQREEEARVAEEAERRRVEEELERLRVEAAERRAEEERLRVEQARKRIEEEAKRKRLEEMETKKTLEEERARREAEERRVAEEEERKRRELEAERLRLEEEERLEKQRRKEEEQRRLEEQRQKAEEERARAEEAKRRFEEEARIKAQEQEKLRLEEEKRRAEEEERKRAEEEAERRRVEEEERKRAEEEKQRVEEERKRVEEEERRRLEEEERKRVMEEERKRVEEEERRIAEEEERKRVEEEERKRAEEEERKRVEEEERRRVDEERRIAEEERKAELREEEERAQVRGKVEDSARAMDEVHSHRTDAPSDQADMETTTAPLNSTAEGDTEQAEQRTPHKEWHETDSAETWNHDRMAQAAISPTPPQEIILSPIPGDTPAAATPGLEQPAAQPTGSPLQPPEGTPLGQIEPVEMSPIDSVPRPPPAMATPTDTIATPAKQKDGEDSQESPEKRVLFMSPGADEGPGNDPAEGPGTPSPPRAASENHPEVGSTGDTRQLAAGPAAEPRPASGLAGAAEQPTGEEPGMGSSADTQASLTFAAPEAGPGGPAGAAEAAQEEPETPRAGGSSAAEGESPASETTRNLLVEMKHMWAQSEAAAIRQLQQNEQGSDTYAEEPHGDQSLGGAVGSFAEWREDGDHTSRSPDAALEEMEDAGSSPHPDVPSGKLAFAHAAIVNYLLRADDRASAVRFTKHHVVSVHRPAEPVAPTDDLALIEQRCIRPKCRSCAQKRGGFHMVGNYRDPKLYGPPTVNRIGQVLFAGSMSEEDLTAQGLTNFELPPQVDYRNFCNNCGTKRSAAASVVVCGGCQMAWYCTRRCQNAHWELGHKEVCPGDGSHAPPPTPPPDPMPRIHEDLPSPLRHRDLDDQDLAEQAEDEAEDEAEDGLVPGGEPAPHRGKRKLSKEASMKRLERRIQAENKKREGAWREEQDRHRDDHEAALEKKVAQWLDIIQVPSVPADPDLQPGPLSPDQAHGPDHSWDPNYIASAKSSPTNAEKKQLSIWGEGEEGGDEEEGRVALLVASRGDDDWRGDRDGDAGSPKTLDEESQSCLSVLLANRMLRYVLFSAAGFAIGTVAYNSVM